MRIAQLSPLIICASIFCHEWPAVSSFSILSITPIRASPSLYSTNGMDVDVSSDKYNHASSEIIYEDDLEENDESKLSCRVMGFYPFPTPPPQGPLGWLLKDTHQAIMVISSRPAKASGSGPRPKKRRIKTTVLMDFMTKGGASHPVWYDEFVKWNVYLGGNIEGEVRMKVLGTKRQRQKTNTAMNENKDNDIMLLNDGLGPDYEGSSKMKRLISFANSYNCEMNLYGNNCRMFAARMEREVERLNLECTDSQSHTDGRRNPKSATIIDVKDELPAQDWSYGMMVADIRCSLRILGAALLPALYPLGAILLIYEAYWIA